MQTVFAEGADRLEMVAHRGYTDHSPFVTYFRHKGAKAACDMARSHRATALFWS